MNNIKKKWLSKAMTGKWQCLSYLFCLIYLSLALVSKYYWYWQSGILLFIYLWIITIILICLFAYKDGVNNVAKTGKGFKNPCHVNWYIFQQLKHILWFAIFFVIYLFALWFLKPLIDPNSPFPGLIVGFFMMMELVPSIYDKGVNDAKRKGFSDGDACTKN